MNDSLAKRFSGVLRELRRARGLTQAEMAEHAGLAIEAYGRLERGAVLPRAETLCALARTLETSTDALLGMEAAVPVPSNREDAEPADIRKLINNVRALDKRARRVVAVVAAEFSKRRMR